MARIAIGKVAPVFKGPYSALIEYSNFNMVTSDGSLYMYINTTPSIGSSLSDPVYWKKVAEKGENGLSAYAQAVDGGYNGSEADFRADLSAIEGLANELAGI